jgi:sucrose-6F-phosphate phosphohydrolase
MYRQQLVVSDLDGTLLGDDDALRQFARWYSQVASRVALVYATGRDFDSVQSSVAATDLPEPDAIIGCVGTEVRCFRTGRALVDWPADLPTARPPHWDAAVVRGALSAVPRMAPQPDEFQTQFKVSFFLPEATADELQSIDALLRHYHLACEIVYSSGLHLDILPHGINKGTAVKNLAMLWRIPADSVVVCGDTANDLAMFQQGFRGVVVANALDELKRLSGDRVYLAQQPHAAGVLEGLLHWLG